MKIALFSDLHTEFGKQPNPFYGMTETADVAVFAGDILMARNSLDFIKLICDTFPEVVYVNGNHEYYQAEFNWIQRRMRKIDIPNFHFLENDCVTISGQRFIGNTLFYNGGTDCILSEAFMNDFRLIHHIDKNGKHVPFRQMIYKYAQDSKAYLRKNVQKGDVVVTHMLPSESCIAQQYKGDIMNGFYFNDCTKIIKENKPKLWLHGHSHQSDDRMIYDTRVVRNPRGYPNEPGLNFNNNLRIEI